MALGKTTVDTLFAEPILKTDISHAISKDQIKYIQSLSMVVNHVNLISEDKYIFNDPKLASIAKAVQEALDVYADEVMGIKHKLYVTQSWSLINKPGTGMHGHSHSNSVVSGSLYYCEMPEPPARVIFDRHRVYQQLQLTPENDKRNIFNTPINASIPKAGELHLFSSSLQHLVEANQSDKPRYSIAFNAFIRGKLGGYVDVSELELK